MVLYADNINDPSTYKVCGIIWGYTTIDTTTCYENFSPFLFNFGQSFTYLDSLEEEQTIQMNDNFITIFMNSSTQEEQLFSGSPITN